MRFLLLTFCLVLLTLACKKKNDDPNAKEPDTSNAILFKFNGQLGESARNSILSNDGNILICGNHNGKIVVTKISPNGEERFRVQFEGGYLASAKCITEDDQGYLYVGGVGTNSSSNKQESLLIKLKQNGDTLWTKRFGDFDNQQIVDIQFSSDLKILALSSGSEPSGNGQFELRKLEKNGTTIWKQKSNTPSNKELTSFVVTVNHHFWVAGWDPSASNSTVFLQEMDSSGLIGSAQSYSLGYYAHPSKLSLNSDGSMNLCGQSQSNTGDYTSFLAQLSANGSLENTTHFGTNTMDDNGYSSASIGTSSVFAGSQKNVSASIEEGTLYFMEPMGTVTKTKVIAHNSLKTSIRNVITLANLYILVGNQGNDFFITLLNAKGEFI